MKYKCILAAGAALLMFTVSGCDLNLDFLKKENTNAVTSTPVPEENTAETPSPTPLPFTPTPLPTSTPAPRMIGTKTSTSKYIFMTNSTENPIREIYLRESNTSEWGKNMVPSESTVKVSERVQLFYPQSDATYYDMKVVDKVGNAYAIYGIDLSDMESAAIRVQDGSASLSYMSVNSGRESSSSDSETLAQNYDANADGFETTVSDYYESNDEHEGDLNYGYYMSNGQWYSYTEEDYANYESGNYSGYSNN